MLAIGRDRAAMTRVADTWDRSLVLNEEALKLVGQCVCLVVRLHGLDQLSGATGREAL